MSVDRGNNATEDPPSPSCGPTTAAAAVFFATVDAVQVQSTTPCGNSTSGSNAQHGPIAGIEQQSRRSTHLHHALSGESIHSSGSLQPECPRCSVDIYGSRSCSRARILCRRHHRCRRRRRRCRRCRCYCTRSHPRPRVLTGRRSRPGPTCVARLRG